MEVESTLDLESLILSVTERMTPLHKDLILSYDLKTKKNRQVFADKWGIHVKTFLQHQADARASLKSELAELGITSLVDLKFT